jgi:hypothetical protein
MTPDATAGCCISFNRTVLALPLQFVATPPLFKNHCICVQAYFCGANLPTLHVRLQARFPQGYSQATTLGAARAQLRYGADYLLAAHTAPDRFVVQVGTAVFTLYV